MEGIRGITQLFQTIVNLSLVGSYCILLVLLVRLVLRKAPRWCSYLLWGIVFIRLICPVFPETRFSLIPNALQMDALVAFVDESAVGFAAWGQGTDAEGLQSNPQGNLVDGANNTLPANQGTSDGAVLNQDALSQDALNQDVQNQNILNQNALNQNALNQNILNQSAQNLASGLAGVESGTGQSQDGIISQHTESGSQHDTGTSVSAGGIIVAAASGIWLVGALLLAGYHTVSYLQLSGKVKMAVPAEPGVKEVQGEHLSFVMGIFQPIIYLSAELDDESRKVILCHEQVHLQRRDYLVKPLALAICCVHWFNPLVWLAFYLMNKDCEISCDEKVVSLLGEESKKIYSYTLLDEATKGESQKLRRGTVCALLSFGEDNVKSRISHVLKYKKTSLWMVAAAVVLLVVLVVGLCSNPGDDVLSKGDDTVEGGTLSEGTTLSKDDVLSKGDGSSGGSDSAVAENVISEADVTEIGEALEQYAWAFIDNRTDGGYAFEGSSLWATDFQIAYAAGSDVAEIRFIMESYAPGYDIVEYYIAKETVKLTKQDEQNAQKEQSGQNDKDEKNVLYEVSREEFKVYHDVQSRQELEEIYDLDVEIPFGNAATGYSQTFARRIFRHLVEETNSKDYAVYTDPVTAAKALLHLGDGSGEVTESLYEAKWNFPFGDPADFGEGSVVNVRYTFAKDGSTVDIPMVLADESEKMWMLSCGDLSQADQQDTGPLPGENARRVYAEFADYEESGRWIKMPIGSYVDKGTAYQISNYGVYRLGYDFRCIYPQYIVMDDIATANIYEGIMYFPTCSTYQEVDLDWMYDSICALSLETGEYNFIPLSQQAMGAFPLNFFHVYDGFIYLDDYAFMLEDTAVVWEGKKAVELDAQERAAYGVSLRNYILEHANTLVSVGNHTQSNTFALIDMDGDGKTEEIELAPHGDRTYTYGLMDEYKLSCGEGFEIRHATNQTNEIYAFSPDGERIFIALYEEGPSADPLTTIFKYEYNQLQYAGEIPQDIRRATFENGVISTVIGSWAVQTDRIHVQYRMTEAGDVELIPQEVYEYTDKSGTDWEWVTLNVSLPVYDAPNGEQSLTLEPQKVRFLRVHNSEEWVYVEGENGQAGWMHIVDSVIVELDMKKWDVFYGLSMAG